MALDDPVVWVLIFAVVVFLFGSGKIPQFARALGQARKEFDNGWRGISQEITGPPAAAPAYTQNAVRPKVDPQSPSTSASPVVSASSPATAEAPQKVQAVDPLVVACENEGISTQGKTREQLAAELSWKLNKK